MVLLAASAVAIVGMASFSVDLGHAYVSRVKDQQIADMAAYAGAVAYTNGSGSTSAMNAAVSRIATLNGLASSAITASVVSSPTNDGNSAVLTTVATTNTVYLATVLGVSGTLPVSASSYAEVQAGTPGCIVALQAGGTGLSLTGGTGVTATNCDVASNGTVTGQNSSVYVHCGTKITTKGVDYASAAAPVQSGCTGIYPPTGTPSVTFTHTTSVDKLAGNPIVTAATARIASVALITSPSGPSVSGGNAISFSYYPTTMSSPPLPAGCSGALSGSIWTVSCNAAGTYTFGSMSIGGGLTINIDTNVPVASRTLNFASDINGTSGTAINFGPGTYNIASGIVASGSMIITFKNAGTFRIGLASSSLCSGGYSICLSGSSRLIIPGPSSFTLAGGIYQNASGMPSTPALSLGAGSNANSFNIGKSTGGLSLNAANGATILGDASASGSLFQTAGGIQTSGGTCAQIPQASEHDINGSINAAGGVYLGAGTYTVNGYASFGAGSGGDVSGCPTSDALTGLTALNVSLILSGATTTTCNGLAGAAFCLGAGYAHVTLTAPTSSTVGSSTAGLAVVGPTTSTRTGAADFTTGATNTQISGVFYFPYGPLSMNGAATLHDTVDSSSCLELVAAQITIAGGSALASNCTGLVGSLTTNGGGMGLVQ